MPSVINSDDGVVSGTSGLKTTGGNDGLLNIQTNGSTAMSVNASQQVTFNNGANLPNTFGFKNRIINGGMTISQRDGTTAVTVNSSNSAFCPDRFNGRIQQASGAMTMQQSTTAPAGFVNSLLMTVTNTTAPASGNRVHVRQIIEGNNIADLAWGTADAKPIVLSFWVRSSITGTYGVGFINSAENRSYVGTYTVNSANTWEYKTIPVTGDTSGAWLTDNGNGIRVTFDLGSGSSYNASSANTWVAQEACRTSGCVNWQQNSGATLYITGVQLEKGSTATSFDFRSYGTELALCQRYYEKSFPIGTVPANGGSATTLSTNDGSVSGLAQNRLNAGPTVQFKVTKRTAPTMTKFGNSGGDWIYGLQGSTALVGSANSGLIRISENAFTVDQQAIDATAIFILGHWTASAEL